MPLLVDCTYEVIWWTSFIKPSTTKKSKSRKWLLTSINRLSEVYPWKGHRFIASVIFTGLSITTTPQLIVLNSNLFSYFSYHLFSNYLHGCPHFIVSSFYLLCHSEVSGIYFISLNQVVHSLSNCLSCYSVTVCYL